MTTNRLSTLFAACMIFLAAGCGGLPPGEDNGVGGPGGGGADPGALALVAEASPACIGCDFNTSDLGCGKAGIGQACANKTGTCTYSENAQPNVSGLCRCYCKGANGEPIVP